jgi:hypothetical protein
LLITNDNANVGGVKNACKRKGRGGGGVHSLIKLEEG